MKSQILTACACLTAFAASANTVLLSENFDGSYAENFPTIINADHNSPHRSIIGLFLNSEGVAQSWIGARDSSTSPNRYMITHSVFTPEGQASGWLCSRAIEIPAEDFKLQFDAQSIAFWTPGRKSSLWVYITESPVTDEHNLPEGEPDLLLEDITFGENETQANDDFTTFTLSLNKYAGKTIYINFANLNNDRDILALDNVTVYREEPGDLVLEEIPYFINGDAVLPVHLTGGGETGLDAWTMDVTFDDGQTYSTSGDAIPSGETVNIDVPFTIGSDQKLSYTVTVKAANTPDIIQKGTSQGLAFRPEHRVLMEESTGLWCSNCPMGQFTIESMMLDPEMNDKVIPVSVHVPSSSHANYLVLEDYATQLGLTVAPAFRLEREFVAKTFSTSHDIVYNPDDPESVAGTIRALASKLTTHDIAVNGEFGISDGDTVTIKAKVNVIPAISTGEERPLAVGLILVENNVWLPNHFSWAQENGLSGFTAVSGDIGGWTLLPRVVPNVHLQDVARGIVGYTGVDDSLPKELKAEETYTYEVEFAIPRTEQFGQNVLTGEQERVAPAIVPAHCGLVAALFDKNTSTVINAAYYPMTEETEQRYTTRDLYTADVEETLAEEISEGEAVYFTLDGLKVSVPVKGNLYICRKGAKTEKLIY